MGSPFENLNETSTITEGLRKCTSLTRMAGWVSWLDLVDSRNLG